MSYTRTRARQLRAPQAQGGLFDFFTGGSGTTGKTVDARPGATIDFARLNMQILDKAISKFGAFKNSDGSAQEYNGLKLPMIPYFDAAGLLTYWEKIGTETVKLIQGYGKSAIAAQQAIAAFKGRQPVWRALAQYAGSGPIAFPLAVQLFDMIISPYAIDLDNATWSGFNIESAAERAEWALGASLPSWLKGVLGWTATVVKWSIYGGLALLAFWGFQKLRQKKEA